MIRPVATADGDEWDFRGRTVWLGVREGNCCLSKGRGIDLHQGGEALLELREERWYWHVDLLFGHAVDSSCAENWNGQRWKFSVEPAYLVLRCCQLWMLHWMCYAAARWFSDRGFP